MTLSLTILMVLPIGILPAVPKGHAVTQCCINAAWSPFGPRQRDVVFKVYQDTTAMVADFDAGLLDITDVADLTGPNSRTDCIANPALTPLGSPPLGCDQNNANYYITNAPYHLALNSWNTESLPGRPSSLVPSVGQGFGAGTPGAYWSLLNMRPNGLVTTGPYRAGGGVPGLVRASLAAGSTGVAHQSVFTSITAWENNLIQPIWDSMLRPNPDTSGAGLQVIDWMTKSHAWGGIAGGTTPQTWNLRRDICWQDSTVSPTGQLCNEPVTADDVCFTIGVQLKGPGAAGSGPGVSNVVSCTYPNPQTVYLVLNATSTAVLPSQRFDIGSLRIVPAHLWETACGWVATRHAFGAVSFIPPTVANAPCVQSGFDPMALTFNGIPFVTVLPSNVSGLMVGSGPYMCVVPSGFPQAGTIGGRCAKNPGTGTLQGQALGVGFTEEFVRFPFYMRCCPDVQGSNQQRLSWSDSLKVGKVFIQDVTWFQSVFSTNDKYFDHPVFGVTRGVVDIGDAAILADSFDSTIIAPCEPNISEWSAWAGANPQPWPWPELSLPQYCPTFDGGSAPITGVDPALDPFLVYLGGGIKMYYMGLTSSGGMGSLELASVGNANPPAALFTASINGGAAVVGGADVVHATAPTIVNPSSPPGGNVLFTFAGLASAKGNSVVISYSGSVIFTIQT